jgi:hypothetical protein
VDGAANAKRDATRLVSCMRSFDAICANALTYTRIFEDHGIDRDQLDKRVTELYEKLKSIHATYRRFDLRPPWTPFTAGGRTYIFVPYSFVLQARGQDTVITASFIGVSADSGASWTFFDGAKVTNENVGMMIPGYTGTTLPPVALSQSAAH